MTCVPLYSFADGQFYRNGEPIVEAAIRAVQASHRRSANVNPMSGYLADQIDQVIADAEQFKSQQEAA